MAPSLTGLMPLTQAIAAYGELNFVTIGVVQQLSALVFEATRLMLVQVLMNSQGYTLNPIQSLYYVSPACLVCLAVPFLVLELPIMRSTDTWTLRPAVRRHGGRGGAVASPAALACSPSGTHIVSASGNGNPEYASSHLLNRMTAMLCVRQPRSAGA